MRDRLLGTWRLVRWATTYDDGHAIFPMGEDAQGFLLYAADGHMSAALFRADRPSFVTGEALTADDAEKVAAWNSYFAYGGTFEVAGSRVIHTVEHCIYPNWLGQRQVREVAFEDDGLVLSIPPQRTRRGLQTSRIVWRRAAAR